MSHRRDGLHRRRTTRSDAPRQLDGIDYVAVDLTNRQVTIEHANDTATVTAALDTLDLGTTHLDDGGTVTARADAEREQTGLRIALLINATLFIAELSFGMISRSMGLIADGHLFPSSEEALAGS